MLMGSFQFLNNHGKKPLCGANLSVIAFNDRSAIIAIGNWAEPAFIEPNYNIIFDMADLSSL